MGVDEATKPLALVSLISASIFESAGSDLLAAAEGVGSFMSCGPWFGIVSSLNGRIFLILLTSGLGCSFLTCSRARYSIPASGLN